MKKKTRKSNLASTKKHIKRASDVKPIVSRRCRWTDACFKFPEPMKPVLFHQEGAVWRGALVKKQGYWTWITDAGQEFNLLRIDWWAELPQPPSGNVD